MHETVACMTALIPKMVKKNPIVHFLPFVEKNLILAFMSYMP